MTHYSRFPILLASLLLLLPFSAQAQTIIRDAEIEEYMEGWFAPIYKSAGMTGDQVKTIIVQDDDINAFVAGGANIFFYTGLIQKTDGPGELIGVMAHELGHIQGGHLIRAREAMENASYESILGGLLGVGAAILTGDGGAAAAIGTGTSSMAQRKFLSTARTYESSADQAAIRYLSNAKLNPTGFMTFMEKLEDQELAPASQQSEYVQTHPLTRNRLQAIEQGVQNSMYASAPMPASWDDQHARMKAKLMGFINPQQVDWNYNTGDKSIPALYARAIAAYRQNQIKTALELADDLLAREPNNPYFHEIKGQMLVDFGQVKEAIPSYQKALSIKPNAGLIRTALAHAQIESARDDQAQLQSAIDNLKIASKTEPRSTRVQRLMATAYGRLGNESAAQLHLAEEALLQGKKDQAKRQAEIALKGLPAGSSDAIRAQDILNYIETGKSKENRG